MSVLKIGLFGGSFNPITNAHLQVAEKALKEVGLDILYFIPAGDPYFKPKEIMASRGDRFTMCQLAALKSNPAFRVSALEVNRPGPSYTSETLLSFVNKFSTNVKYEFYIIVGDDKLEEIPKWHDVGIVYMYANFVVIKRDYDDLIIPDELKSFVAHVLEPVNGREISSTLVRKNINKHKSIAGLVPPEVEDYILTNKLYLE